MKTKLAFAALIIALVALGLTSPQAQDEPGTTSWQHLAMERDATLPLSTGDFAQKINQVGRDGWELVTVLNFDEEGTTTKTVYYFKKPL